MSGQLQRLVLTFTREGVEVRTLYRKKNGPNPSTKARCKEVTELTREGLRRALAALEGRVDVVGSAGFEGRVDVVGSAGFETREDTLLISASPAALETTWQVKTKPKGA